MQIGYHSSNQSTLQLDTTLYTPGLWGVISGGPIIKGVGNMINFVESVDNKHPHDSSN